MMHLLPHPESVFVTPIFKVHVDLILAYLIVRTYQVYCRDLLNVL